jgi:protein-disulfide isomerase
MSTLKVPVGASDHAQGEADAVVTLVEYGDYECPYCGEAYPVVKAIQQRFGNDVRFIFRNFPIAQLHPHALVAAMTAEFAGAHGQFWAVHDALFEQQASLGLPLFEQVIADCGLSPERLRDAIDKVEFADRIRDDFNGGVRSGVNGTPSFFINGRRYDGPPEERAMGDALETAIAEVRGPRSRA